MIQAAQSKADTYCQNPFLDYDGKTQLDIPPEVDMWILNTVSKMYNHRTIGIHKEEVVDLGAVQYEKLADVDVNYDGIKNFRKNAGFGSYFIS